jgi:hypothetical protein
MPTPTSQGSTCIFNGSTLGTVTRFRASPAAAVFIEKTNITSTVIGTGTASRILKTYDCVAIDPGTVEVTLWGCPPYAYSDVGLRATANFTWDGGSLVLPAYLETFDVVGQVGQFLVGQAVFRLTGESS